MPRQLVILCGIAPLLACGRPASPPDRPPAELMAELLDADRNFGRANTSLPNALGAMFANDVVIPAPGGFAKGAAQVRAALSAGPDSAATLQWAPIGGGLSADGRHGFTYGYMTMQRGDSTIPFKYLAYWVKGAEGWRVAVYRRGRRAPGAGTSDSMAPSVPERMGPEITDSAVLAEHRASLAQVEKDFSDEAQRIGLKAAFAKYGRADAVNMGGPARPDFVVGAPAISEAVSGKWDPLESTCRHASLSIL